MSSPFLAESAVPVHNSSLGASTTGSLQTTGADNLQDLPSLQLHFKYDGPSKLLCYGEVAWCQAHVGPVERASGGPSDGLAYIGEKDSEDNEEAIADLQQHYPLLNNSSHADVLDLSASSSSNASDYLSPSSDEDSIFSKDERDAQSPLRYRSGSASSFDARSSWGSDQKVAVELFNPAELSPGEDADTGFSQLEQGELFDISDIVFADAQPSFSQSPVSSNESIGEAKLPRRNSKPKASHAGGSSQPKRRIAVPASSRTGSRLKNQSNLTAPISRCIEQPVRQSVSRFEDPSIANLSVSEDDEPYMPDGAVDHHPGSLDRFHIPRVGKLWSYKSLKTIPGGNGSAQVEVVRIREYPGDPNRDRERVVVFKSFLRADVPLSLIAPQGASDATMNRVERDRWRARDMFQREYLVYRKLARSFCDSLWEGGYGCRFVMQLDAVVSCPMYDRLVMTAAHGDLRSMLKHHAPVSYGEVWRLIGQSVMGIHFLHSNDIIHADLKPENIFLDDERNVLIGDFGHSFSLRCEWEEHPTPRHAFVGTHAYAAPECHNRDSFQPGMHRAIDYWSLGCVFWELTERHMNKRLAGYGTLFSEQSTRLLNEFLSYRTYEERASFLWGDFKQDRPADSLRDLILGLLEKYPQHRVDYAAILKNWTEDDFSNMISMCRHDTPLRVRSTNLYDSNPGQPSQPVRLAWKNTLGPYLKAVN